MANGGTRCLVQLSLWWLKVGLERVSQGFTVRPAFDMVQACRGIELKCSAQLFGVDSYLVRACKTCLVLFPLAPIPEAKGLVVRWILWRFPIGENGSLYALVDPDIRLLKHRFEYRQLTDVIAANLERTHSPGSPLASFSDRFYFTSLAIIQVPDYNLNIGTFCLLGSPG